MLAISPIAFAELPAGSVTNTLPRSSAGTGTAGAQVGVPGRLVVNRLLPEHEVEGVALVRVVGVAAVLGCEPEHLLAAVADEAQRRATRRNMASCTRNIVDESRDEAWLASLEQAMAEHGVEVDLGDAVIDHVPEEGREHNTVECAKRPATV